MDGTFKERFPTGERFGMLFVVNFVFAFHLFFAIYFHSSFLETFINERLVGSVWVVGSVFSVLTLLLAPTILRRIGNYLFIVLLAVLQMIVFLALASTLNTFFIIVLFAIFLSVYPLILFCIDIFLESYIVEEGATGNIRGIFLTTTNVALIIAPFFAGRMLTNGNYSTLYVVSAILLIPFIALLFRFRRFKDPLYYTPKIIDSIRGIWRDKNIYRVFMAQFILRLFYAAMVIYLPVYLHNHIGFTWSEFGVMATIMLLPYALFEWPAGKIADKKFGEKEMLVLGFAITAISTTFIPFITSNSFFLWTALLFLGRSGASLIEIMSESYFFKHVRGENDDIIGFFRILNPFAYVVGPLGATVILVFFDIQYIFLFLAFILLWGIRYGMTLDDTR